MPADALNKLNAGIAKALQDSELKAALAKFGIEPRGTTLAEGAAFTKSDYQKWKKIIEDGHITLDQ
jgi:tripartite-type tricarboxylate transporter receptor subunit TctC